MQVAPPIDLAQVLSGASELDLASGPSRDQIRDAFRKLSPFDGGVVTLGKWSGQAPWERHVDGDELFLVLDGELEITLLTDDEETRVKVAKGSMFVIPQGHWHRTVAHHATTLTVRASDHGPVSFAEDPRLEDGSTLVG